ncbi:hypothetical protein N7510_001572 [Penicillium lagena]|uniref:uncharacterized protein n=1 Tax=Penicillium lagena TaxID=94218 RepID=UPI00254095A5|nr:uncharacterized protein N7510_001572 [Penicillium lagena]KAJ5625263.1 hypothetical protein N7510_001572 [Penicillium lagena]
MSTLNNVESVNEGSGFKPSVAPEGPMTTKGHQPGRKVNEADQRPTFEAQTFPEGTAPASSSHVPNPISNPGSQALNPDVLRAHGKESVHTAPGDTLTGSTSADVHRGLGKPVQGQTSTEIRHEGAHGRKKQPSGLEGVGANYDDRGIERQFPDQRGLEKEQNVSGLRGNKAERAAEDMDPNSA